MKTISISIPTYNEEENVLPLYEALREQLASLEEKYDYEIVFIDNKSTDRTREKIRQLCERDTRVKAIFNTRNFGQNHSSFYGALQTTGDCTICMNADFQDPPVLLPRIVEAWEQGYKIVCMVKTESRENPLVRAMRTAYYKTLRKLSGIDIIEHFTSFGLYDKSVLDVARRLNDPDPFPRGMAAEISLGVTTIPYTQEKRRAGKSSNNLFTLYDLAMLGFVTYTKVIPRLAVLLGGTIAGASFIGALVCLIFGKWTALAFLGLFVLGGVQLIFLGLLGEYIINIQRRSMKRPLVFEEYRLNF